MMKKVALISVAIVIGVATLFLAIDLDGDGLSNFSEFQCGASMFNSDTDGDGVFDGQEVSIGTNPLIPEYLSIKSEQHANNLIVFGMTNLPENLGKLTISIPSLDIFAFCDVDNHQYEYKLQRSVNVPSAKIQVLVSHDSTNIENITEINWVRVNNPPIPDFTYNQKGYKVEYIDISSDVDGTIVDWKWDFGIAGKSSSDQNPTCNYASRDIYEVKLTVTDNGGAHTTCTKIFAVPDTILYTWGYSGRGWKYELKISDEIVNELIKYKNMSHTVRWTTLIDFSEEYEPDIKKFVTPNDKIIKAFAENLKAMYVDHYGMSEYGLADFVLGFVQEEIQYGILEIYFTDWEYALEALVGVGSSCVGQSILYASLMEALDYHACLIILPSGYHMMAGVHLSERPSMATCNSDEVLCIVENIVENGVVYWPAETTDPRWNLGERYYVKGEYYDILGWYECRHVIQISSGEETT